MGKTTRKSAPALPQLSNKDVERYVSEYAVADAEMARINAEMDVRITAIRQEYGVRLLELEAKKKSSFDVVQHWANMNKDSLFGRKKSLDLAHGTVGFRLGNWKAVLAKGVKKWDEVLDACRTLAPEWIRVKEEVNKEVIIAGRDDEGVAAKLSTIGVAVVQEESFFIELKKEEFESF